ncbi:MAG: hypothetical protein IIC21_05785 [Chloroflexi bacterium]|nr:hypothetical protein [Chloroflexota bacterium]
MKHRSETQNWGKIHLSARKRMAMSRPLRYKPKFAPLKALLLDMAKERSCDSVLRLIVERLTQTPQVALCRIWLTQPICKECMAQDPTRKECLTWLRMMADHAAAAIANSRAFEEIERPREHLELENTFLRQAFFEAAPLNTQATHSVTSVEPIAYGSILTEEEMLNFQKKNLETALDRTR